jgi:hypothetical protein
MSSNNFMNNSNQPTMDQQQAMEEYQRQLQELVRSFNIADPTHPGNAKSKKKFWVKILLTEFQLRELQRLAQMLGTQPYINPQDGQPVINPDTGKPVHAIEDTTVATLMKSAACGTYLKYRMDEWQRQQQQQMQQQQQQQQQSQFFPQQQQPQTQQSASAPPFQG